MPPMCSPILHMTRHYHHHHLPNQEPTIVSIFDNPNLRSLNITSWKSVWLGWCWEIMRDLPSCYDLHSIFDILNIAKLDCVQIKVEVDGVSSVPFRCLVGGRLTESQLSRFTLPSLCLCAFSLIDFLLQCFVLVQFCLFPRTADTLILKGKKGAPIICGCF